MISLEVWYLNISWICLSMFQYVSILLHLIDLSCFCFTKIDTHIETWRLWVQILACECRLEWRTTEWVLFEQYQTSNMIKWVRGYVTMYYEYSYMLVIFLVHLLQNVIFHIHMNSYTGSQKPCRLCTETSMWLRVTGTQCTTR